MNIDEIFKLAIQNHQKNNLKEAENLYNEILKIDPDHIASLNNLGLIFHSSNNLLKAEKFFKKAIKIDPNFSDAYYNLGKLFTDVKEYLKAITLYEKTIKIKPDYTKAHHNLGIIFKELGEFQKSISCFKKEIEIDPQSKGAHNNIGVLLKELGDHVNCENYFKKAIEIDENYYDAIYNLANLYVNQLDNFEKTIKLSQKSLKIKKNSETISQEINLFRLKHDVQQSKYLSKKNTFWNFFKTKKFKISGINEFQKVGHEILSRKENQENIKMPNKKILLTNDEINALLPFYKSDYVYQPKKIKNYINPNKNWREVEDQYFNNSKQIIYIDDFLSNEALIELREFCLVSKIWNREYTNKYLGAFSEEGFISPIHLEIAVELKQKLPKLFGPHKLGKFWGFKYDSSLGSGIKIHADFAIHNLNFWITPDKYNNKNNSGGLKVYDVPAPEKWTFKDFNSNDKKIYDFLKKNNSKCVNVPYKCNRAVLFNSAYFHETDEIDFKDEYEGRRINITYLFGNRNNKTKSING